MTKRKKTKRTRLAAWALDKINSGDAAKATVERLRAANRRLRARLKAEQRRWDERCPKGHLVRYDECDLVGCYLVPIEPLPPSGSWFPKDAAPGTVHAWMQDSLDAHAGWWWRRLWGWLLNLFGRKK